MLDDNFGLKTTIFGPLNDNLALKNWQHCNSFLGSLDERTNSTLASYKSIALHCLGIAFNSY